MAKAYGGQARGPPKRSLPRGNARNINTPGTINGRENLGSKLGRVAGSVSGFH